MTSQQSNTTEYSSNNSSKTTTGNVKLPIILTITIILILSIYGATVFNNDDVDTVDTRDNIQRVTDNIADTSRAMKYSTDMVSRSQEIVDNALALLEQSQEINDDDVDAYNRAVEALNTYNGTNTQDTSQSSK